MIFFLFSVEYISDSTLIDDGPVSYSFNPSFSSSSSYAYPLAHAFLSNSHYGNEIFLNQLNKIKSGLNAGEKNLKLEGIFTDVSGMSSTFQEISMIGEIKISIKSCDDYKKSFMEFSKLKYLEKLNVHFFISNSKSFCKKNSLTSILSPDFLENALFQSLQSLSISFHLSPLEETLISSRHYLLNFTPKNFPKLSFFSFSLHKRAFECAYFNIQQELPDDLKITISSSYEDILKYENLNLYKKAFIKKIRVEIHNVFSSYSYFSDQTMTTANDNIIFDHFSEPSSFEGGNTSFGEFFLYSKGPYSIDLSFI